MVMVWLPVDARLPTVTFMVDVPEPGAAMLLGVKVTVWLLPSPEAVRVIAELKPPETAVVMVDVPELPRATEAERLVIARIGQDVFRKALLDYWGGRCPLTGISDPALLRASHIVPWADCESDELRLDVHNGLLLSALWDAAFDAGLVSFSDDGTPLASQELTPESRVALGLCDGLRIEGIVGAHHINLSRHRERNGFRCY